jgi:hypothetical protein
MTCIQPRDEHPCVSHTILSPSCGISHEPCNYIYSRRAYNSIKIRNAMHTAQCSDARPAPCSLMQVQNSQKKKQKRYKRPSSSSFQPSASYIDGSASSLAGTEKGTGAASIVEAGVVLVGVAITAGGVKLVLVGGEVL